MVKLRRYLKPHKDRGAFNSLLAPHAFVDDNVFLTKSNQLGLVYKLTGIDDECLTSEALESYTKRVEKAFRAFSERFRIYQYVIKQDRAPIEQGDSFPTAATRSTAESRREFLQAKGLYSLELFFVILYEPEGIADGGIKKTLRGLAKLDFSSKKVLRVIVQEFKRNLDALMGQAISFERTVGELLGLQRLDKQEAFSFFRLLANLDPELARSERLKHSTHVDYFMASAAPYFPADNQNKIGRADVELLSMREAPAQTIPNVLRDLLTLETNFILCTEFKRSFNITAIDLIRKTQTFWQYAQYMSDIPSLISMVLHRGQTEEVLPDKSALALKDELDGSVARINLGGEHLGEFSFTVLLYGWGNRAKLEAAAVDTVKIFGNAEGSLYREDLNALNAYLSIIPGNQAFNLRKIWLLSRNYADLSFLYAPHTGERHNPYSGREAITVLETDEAVPYYFGLAAHDRLGALLFGVPGSGKTILAKLLIDHSQKHSPHTFILDMKGSYRQITEKHGGSYLSMHFGDGLQTFKINPFVLPGTDANIQFLCEFIAVLLEGAGYQPSADDARQIFEGIHGMYLESAASRTLGNFADVLPKHLANALQAWTKGGQYGNVFDNAEDTLTFARFQAFDFQGMDRYPRVITPLLFFIFHCISQIVCDPANLGADKTLWADECWKFLNNQRARDYLIEAAKTWREFLGGLVLITQSAEDLRSAGILELINEICPTKLLLANPDANRAEYQKLFKLNEKELAIFGQLIPKRQFLLKTEQRSKLLNVNVDPEALAAYSNDPVAKLKRLEDLATRELVEV